MGLDVVEIVLECEEKFDVEIEDWRLEQMRTVGDLFELICQQLQLPFGKEGPPPKMDFGDPSFLKPVEGWTRDAVWSSVVWICMDRLRVKAPEVTYNATFSGDLRAD